MIGIDIFDEKAFVSVITLYLIERYVLECLESASQGFVYEHLFIDGGSTDKSVHNQKTKSYRIGKVKVYLAPNTNATRHGT